MNRSPTGGFTQTLKDKFLAILPYGISGFGEIGRISAARSVKAAEMVAFMSDAKIAISNLLPEFHRRRERQIHLNRKDAKIMQRVMISIEQKFLCDRSNILTLVRRLGIFWDIDFGGQA